MKKSLLLFIVFAFPLLGVCQEDILKIVNSQKNRNLRLDKSLAIDERLSTGSTSYQQNLRKIQVANTDYSTNINAIFKKYDAQRKENEIGLNIVKGNSFLIKTSLLCLSDKQKIPILCNIAENGLRKVESMVIEEMEGNSRKILKNGLDDVMRKAGKNVEEAIKSNQNPQAFLDALNAHSNIMEGLYKNLPNATNEDKEFVKAAMLKTIDNEIKTGFKGVNVAETLTKTELEQVNKNVTALSISFFKYAESNNKKLEQIVSIQNDINGQLKDINERTGKTEKGVEFLQDFFFNKMTPEEKINALKLGMVPGIPDSKQRQDLIQKISLYQKQQQLVSSIQGYLEGASEIVSFAKTLGLNPKLADGLSKGIAIAAGAFNAAASIMSGNYIGAISAVAGVIGIGGPDVAAERHKEIMEALGKIYEKLDVIEQKIDELRKGQQIILENQKKTFDALVSISKQIDKNQEEVRTKLEQIHQDIIYDRGLITNYVRTGYTSCCRLVANDCESSSPDTIINTELNKFPTYNQLVLLCTKWTSTGDIDKCFNIIGEIMKSDGTFDNPIFNLQSSSEFSDYNSVHKFIDSIHSPLVSFLNSDTTVKDFSLDEKRTSLFVPSTTVRSLDEKLNQIKDQHIEISHHYNFQSFGTNISKPLWFESVQRHLNAILNIHYYRMAINKATLQPYTKAELINNEVNLAGYDDLKRGLALVDYAIAQQNLYSGDILLPILYNVWSIIDSTNRERKSKVIRLLNNNSQLAYNFIIYSVSKEIETGSVMSYSSGYNSKDINNFSLNFKNNWNLKWSDSSTTQSNKTTIPKGWATKIGEQYYEMPTPEEVQLGRLSYSQNIQILLSLKSRILEELDTYSIYKSMTLDQKKSFNILNVSTIPESIN